MHRSRVQLCLDELIPDDLLTYLDGEAPPIEPPLETQEVSSIEAVRPRKRRKVSRENEQGEPQHSIDPSDYLTIARVDVGLAVRSDASQSYPSRSSSTGDGAGKELPIVLERFERESDDNYRCRLAFTRGDALIDCAVRSSITPQELDILSVAISPPGRRHQKGFIQAKITVSKEMDSPQIADITSSSNDIYLHILNIEVRILAKDACDLSGSIGISRNDVLSNCLPQAPSHVSAAWSPRDFYDSVYVPKVTDGLSTLPAINQLQCKLYPFQERAIQWLLRREGVADNAELNESLTELPHGFVHTTDADGRPCLASRFLGIVTTDADLPMRMGTNLKGGILAEEMGLGKTVEMTALICSHKYDDSQKRSATTQLPHSSATLIVTPPAILEQWNSELQQIAPNLSVYNYRGLRAEAGKSNHRELLAKCMSFDVVLTTYNILAKEIHYTETAERALRHEKKYEKRRSPLTQLLWWRVVLDEAQMVESGVSNAAKVAKLIPRQMAWCVSGTPVKKDARDLFGLLDFLGYQPYCSLPTQCWDHLVVHHRDIFRQIFGNLALRHTKDQIKDEIRLPLQKRVVINVPFTQIEEQHYSAMFTEMSADCGLNADGAPLTGEWDPESPTVIEKMRTWLVRLRQTCLHPEVGARNRRALGNGKGPLRTVGEVLEVMIEQNDSLARAEERALLLSKIRRGQILEHAELSEQALQIWLPTLAEARSVVQDCRDQLKIEVERLGLTEDLLLSGGTDDLGGVTALRTGLHRNRLRAALEIEHMCVFFVANAYFQIKSDEDKTKPESDEYHDLEKKEEESYEKAKALRKELLLEARKKADTLIGKISSKAESNALVALPKTPNVDGNAGIETRTYVDRLNDLIITMQRQDVQFAEWREKTTKLLLMPLVDEEETDLQGDEYEASTKQQDEVYVYVDVLRALIADRHDIITGQHNELIRYETKQALRQAQEGGGHSPELQIKLITTRNKLLPNKDLGSIRGLTAEIRELKTSLRGAVERGSARAAAELLILNGVFQKLHKMSIEQSKAVAELEREIELFRDTMNLRLEYYRQLQQISDTVAPYEEDLDEEARHITLRDKEAYEHSMRSRLATLKAKSRYLIHLRDEATNVESQRMCIICQQPFEIGVLTTCGHSYCVDCLRIWWNTHRNCPTCKKHLHRNDLHQITYKPQDLTMEEEDVAASSKEVASDTKSGNSKIYSGIRGPILNQIKNIDIDGSFGTKIDTLARHILWIREHDPGAKSVIFSQYRDFLDVLARAFSQFKIGFTGIDRKGGIQKFKYDPSKEVFFLHAKAHSSGLNLVNATHVFLCEPLINTAIELQAIARVHRIGQHQATTIWMYLIENTVEKSIYDISVTRRLALIGQRTTSNVNSKDVENLENKIEAANNLEIEQTPLANLLTKASAGGEMVDKDDLWNCLFRLRPGQTGRVSQEAEREVARHFGAEAAEARMTDANDGTMIES